MIGRILTRDDIDAIVPDVVVLKRDGFPSRPARVVDIFARQEDVEGLAFVCGYLDFGPGAKVSFSAKEGTDDLRIVSEWEEIFPAD